jgi:hypothetical protein
VVCIRFGRCPVRISAGMTIIMSKEFRGLPQSIQRVYLEIGRILSLSSCIGTIRTVGSTARSEAKFISLNQGVKEKGEDN